MLFKAAVHIILIFYTLAPESSLATAFSTSCSFSNGLQMPNIEYMAIIRSRCQQGIGNNGKFLSLRVCPHDLIEQKRVGYHQHIGDIQS